MSTLFDARTNEWQGDIDGINGITLTDGRTAVNTLNSLGSVSLDIVGKATLMVHLNVTVAFSGGTSLIVEGTVDGSNFFQVPFFIVQSPATGASPTGGLAESMSNIIPFSSPTGQYLLCTSATGFRQMRVRMNAFSATGTAIVAMRATRADFRIYAQPQPTMLVGTFAGLTNAAQTLLAAPAAGLFLYVTSIHVTWHSTAAVVAAAPPLVQFSNLGAAAATSRFASGPGVAAGAGVFDSQVISYPNPIKAFASATAIQAQLSAAAIAGSSITVTMTGYAGA